MKAMERTLVLLTSFRGQVKQIKDAITDAEAAATQRERERLRENGWLQHRRACHARAYTNWPRPDDEQCTCGLAAAIRDGGE
jgi:hypothetical protein